MGLTKSVNDIFCFEPCAINDIINSWPPYRSTKGQWSRANFIAGYVKMISWNGMFDICIDTSSKNRPSNLKHPYWVHVFNWYKSTGRLHVCFDRVRTRCNTVQYEDRWIKHQNIKSMNKNINIWSKANDKLIKQRHRWSYFAYDAENDLSNKFRFRGTVRKCLNRVWF